MSAIPAISPALASIGGLGSLGSLSTPAPAAAPASGSGGGFTGALSNAISALQSTQADANTAAQQLATGQLTDPTVAITAVENAQLAMELASQITTKAVGAVQTIFQTQL